jgi:hypothetical protein
MNYEEIEALQIAIELAKARVADASLSRSPDRVGQIAQRKDELAKLEAKLAEFSVDTGTATSSERKLWMKICSGEVAPAQSANGNDCWYITAANGNSYVVVPGTRELRQYREGHYLFSEHNHRVARMPSYFPKWEG